VGRAGARSAERAGAKTTKAVRKTASKETVKSAVTSIARTSKEPKEPKGTERKGGEPAASPRAAKAAKSPVAANSAAAKPAPKPAAKPAPKPAAKIPRPAAAPSAPAKKRGPRRAAPAGPYAHDEKFLLEQRQLLEEERKVHQSQASDLKAEADSLAQEREPGDVQFDEESGEGGTVTVDRERDLALSAQALAAVEEIDAALARIENRTYGACERCLHPIPKPRLKALPFARLCVACKSGGLSRR
jgi:DnaK suppressor protein